MSNSHDNNGNNGNYDNNDDHNITDPSHNITDPSHNITDPSHNTTDPSHNTTDPSHNTTDPSHNTIVDYTMNQTVNGTGFQIVTEQGTTLDGSNITHVTFTTLDPSSDIQISENLTEVVSVYNDMTPSSPAELLVNQIKLYASEINCSNFQGKGTVDDYTELFVAASKIANETKQMQLDVDIEGFNEFAQAADDLSALFTSFIVRLESINIINDIDFLTSISIALGKIVNLSKVFAQFKTTILATSTFQLPKSAHDTATVLHEVMDELTCAMGYIKYFVDPSSSAIVPLNSELSEEEQNIINSATATIDNWSIICDQGVSVAMNNNPDIQYISHASDQLKSTTGQLKTMTQTLRSKFSAFSFSSPTN